MPCRACMPCRKCFPKTQIPGDKAVHCLRLMNAKMPTQATQAGATVCDHGQMPNPVGDHWLNHATVNATAADYSL